MELRQLRYFIAVADDRNFRSAAQRLRISQSAVSQQIRTLERTLRVRLFDRDARPVALTDEGRALLDRARLIVELADRAQEELRTSPRFRKRILKFGGSTFGGGPAIDRILAEVRERLPEIDVQVEFDTVAHHLIALGRREIDVAFGYRPFASHEEPEFLKLGSLEILLAIPAANPLAKLDRITKAQLLEEPFLMGPRSLNPPLYDRIHRALIGLDEHPRRIPISDVGAGRFRLVAQGLGISPVAVPMEPLLPIPGVTYRRIEGPPPAIDHGLMWYDERVSPALPAFLDVARDVARSLPDPSAELEQLAL